MRSSDAGATFGGAPDGVQLVSIAAIFGFTEDGAAADCADCAACMFRGEYSESEMMESESSESAGLLVVVEEVVGLLLLVVMRLLLGGACCSFAKLKFDAMDE